MDKAARQAGLTLFAVLYALAALFETRDVLTRVQHVTNLVTISQSVCFVTGVWLLLRPGSLARFLVFCGVHAATVLSVLPLAPNHWLLGLAVDLTFLAAFARLALAGARRPVTRDALFATAAPLVRLQLLALYFWAVFHKLNVDFFDRAVSCGAVQLFRLQEVFPFLPVDFWARGVAIHGTLLVEATIPLLLVFRRTRMFGVALGGTFHFALGFLYPGFSANLFAYFSLFLGGACFAVVPDAAELRRRLAPGVLAFAATYALLVGAFDTQLSLVGVLWLLYGFGWIGVLLPLVARSRGADTLGGPAFALPHPGLLVLPLLVFLNGANPYLGFKNVQSFSMFSNLRTGGGESNHLLIPASWQLAGYQRDLVTILSSSDSVLSELTEARRYIHFFSTSVFPSGNAALDGPPPRWRLPYAALQRRVNHYRGEGRTGLRVRYERGGEVHEVERAETLPELTDVSWLARKFFLLRAVPVGEHGLCLW